MKQFESLKKLAKAKESAPSQLDRTGPVEEVLEGKRSTIREERRAALSSLLEKEPTTQLAETILCPKVAFLTDGAHIENQQVSIIKMPDESYRATFKLTQPAWIKVLQVMDEEWRSRESEVVHSEITFRNVSPEGKEISLYTLSNALSIYFSDHTVKVATATLNGEGGGYMRASQGLVEITVPNEGSPPTFDKTLSYVNQFLRSRLGIEDIMDVPDVEATQEYKRNRYIWHHKMEAPPLGAEDGLARKEVFPGFFTLVEEGKYKEYMRISPYAVYHECRTINNIPDIISSGGLMSSFERFSRGLMRNGMSTDTDMETGGADSVFTRIVTESANDTNLIINPNRVYIVFRPDILDRTDWYAYEYDQYGRTDPDIFSNRSSPKEFFESQSRYCSATNEQMFRTGIASKDIATIACANHECRQKMIQVFEDAGILDIQGKPIREMFFVTENFRNIITFSKHLVPK